MALLDELLGTGGGDVNPYAAPAPAPTAAPSPLQPQAAPSQAPITVSAQDPDSWHPHKRSLLGTVADFALAALGFPLFPFGHANHAQNIQEAMQGFQAKPREAIRRLSQIKGEEFDAAKLAGGEDDSDMKAANYKRMNDALDFQKQKQAEGIAANMMYSASQSKDPASSWTAMREQVARRDAVNGTNIADEIPEAPDLSAIDILANGNIPAWRQASLFERTQHDRATEDVAKGNLGERVQHDRTTEGQGAARVGISETNAKTGQYNAQTARTREEKYSPSEPKQQPKKFLVTMKNGMKIPFTDRGDNSGYAVDPSTGTAHAYIKVKGTWVPTGQSVSPNK